MQRGSLESPLQKKERLSSDWACIPVLPVLPLPQVRRQFFPIQNMLTPVRSGKKSLSLIYSVVLGPCRLPPHKPLLFIQLGKIPYFQAFRTDWPAFRHRQRPMQTAATISFLQDARHFFCGNKCFLRGFLPTRNGLSRRK